MTTNDDGVGVGERGAHYHLSLCLSAWPIDDEGKEEQLSVCLSGTPVP